MICLGRGEGASADAECSPHLARVGRVGAWKTRLGEGVSSVACDKHRVSGRLLTEYLLSPARFTGTEGHEVKPTSHTC